MFSWSPNAIGIANIAQAANPKAKICCERVCPLGGRSVDERLIACLGHKIAECRQSNELASGEEIFEIRKAIAWG